MTVVETTWMPRLACPECRAELGIPADDHISCSGCRRAFERRAGVWRFLTPARGQRLDPFVQQFRAVRERERRRPSSPEYYQRLPTVADESFTYDDGGSRRAHTRARHGLRAPAQRLTSAGHAGRSGPAVVRERPPPYVPFTEPPPLDHTHVQWLLAKIGQQLGCRVWIAANDRRRVWGTESLGSLSVTRLPPLGMAPDSQRLVSLIDVVWLSGANQVAAAFEVEHTTSVYSGLLRMADLAALAPNLNFPLYIVAPASRLAKVARELKRPTFRALGLRERCRFFSSEALLRALPSLARWATGPEAIEKLAEQAPDD